MPICRRKRINAPHRIFLIVFEVARVSRRSVSLPVELAGGAHVAVVGESFYQGAIAKTAANAPLDEEDPDWRAFRAVLVREPGNEYDPNAIGVYSSFGQVGHLSREAAVEYGHVFEEIARQGADAGACVGLIGRQDPALPYGVVLRLSIPRICIEELQV